jgi:hypothetical protein
VRHFASPGFWEAYTQLPESMRSIKLLKCIFDTIKYDVGKPAGAEDNRDLSWVRGCKSIREWDSYPK